MATTESNGTMAHTGTQVEVVCGPLLNYKGMSNANTPNPTWHGSVLIVTPPHQPDSQLTLRCVEGEASTAQPRQFPSEKIYEDEKAAFFRFKIDLPIQTTTAKWEYRINDMNPATSATKEFHVQSVHESMRIMFHSCNGFSVGTDIQAWSGCAMWNEVLRKHQEKPIHVMIGGGDQIYNDWIRTEGPLKEWTSIANPEKRARFPFDDKLRAACDEYYFNNYRKWYTTQPFAGANGIIPQVNIWDDHDIIDGFGSYIDHFMKCPVFMGIGGVAHKYYLLFQHHNPPPKSTFTTDPTREEQARNHFVLEEKEPDPSYIFGKRPGPYVEDRSRSLYMQLGAHIAFLGIDARTERTHHQVNYHDTYDILFKTLSQKLQESGGTIKHLILLLGVPIAYPRLQWLENILRSPIIGPIKLLNKRFGVAGGLFNQFDGGVDLMDDLDDHYTARQHKKERKELVHHLQKISKDNSVRVTILGGDVHLAAFGRFYSNPKLNIPVEQDWRFMANIVSSAITNKPPPMAVANLLARRNKVHHLDHDTDETLLNIWDKDPGENENPSIQKKKAAANHCTMPSRNFALITESNEHTGATANGTVDGQSKPITKDDNPRSPMHPGEEKCGITHPASSGVTKTGLGGHYGLDVCYRVEIDRSDRNAKTEGYGVSIPALDCKGATN